MDNIDNSERTKLPSTEVNEQTPADLPRILPRQLITGRLTNNITIGSGLDKLDGPNNIIKASGINNATTTVDTSDSAAPASTYALIASSSTVASWRAVKDSDLSLSDITTNDVSTTKHGFVPKAPNLTTKFLRGDGSWAIPTSGGATTASDTYTGNGGTNTAIAHGLGATPKFVYILNSNSYAAGQFTILGANGTILRQEQTLGTIAVTAMDATNFYVSGAANTNTNVYYWFAVS